ncbi:hypothetical protein [Ligilactobacillus equi]|uniref:Uncharacterized protein n=2 Tax=Ligilactobacillus equi TaxID=137357 RepID=V7HZW7_9LACO|nr:hypothetical protein [Ligilactobacillus equi]ETA74566.1 hypothetical protein LEQ_0431c [Ligilactobacillus equi DPC 6820]KRL84349.1 hypothetical protein FC36_GL000272 [Ligilactobacillus equi DSM 15833 = JCM 10991]
MVVSKYDIEYRELKSKYGSKAIRKIKLLDKGLKNFGYDKSLMDMNKEEVAQVISDINEYRKFYLEHK